MGLFVGEGNGTFTLAYAALRHMFAQESGSSSYNPGVWDGITSSWLEEPTIDIQEVKKLCIEQIKPTICGVWDTCHLTHVKSACKELVNTNPWLFNIDATDIPLSVIKLAFGTTFRHIRVLRSILREARLALLQTSKSEYRQTLERILHKANLVLQQTFKSEYTQVLKSVFTSYFSTTANFQEIQERIPTST